MLALILGHGAAALAIAATRLGRRALLVAALPPAAAVVWLLTQASRVNGGDPVSEATRWVPELGLGFDFRLDDFSLLMTLLVSGVAVGVLVWSLGYLSDDGAQRLAGPFVAFSGAMTGLVLASDVFTLFIFWELTSVFSFLLIGFNDRAAESRNSALQALLVTSVGGLALLGGLVLLSIEAGTSSIAGIVGADLDGTLVAVAGVLVLVGAFTKSAQVPFHFWLPGAMAAPTPVSAFLHSATMVKAGIILVARLAPGLAEVGPWRWLVVAAGVGSLLVGGLRAMRQDDLKLLLAHSTVSQLGLLMLVAGIGIPSATLALVGMLLAHALAKAALFLVVGVIDHEAGTRMVGELSGLGRHLPVTFAVAIAASASMVALPPTFGWVTKEKGLAAVVDGGLGVVGVVAVVGFVAGSMLTVAYTLRFLWGGFATKAAPTTAIAHRPGATLLGSPAVLAALGVAAGVGIAAFNDWLVPAGVALDASAGTSSFALWPGLGLPLYLSLAIFLGGAVLAAGHAQLGALPTSPVAADAVYRSTLGGLLRGSPRLVGVFQNGSLPFYLAVVMAVVAAALAAGVLGSDGLGPADLVALDSPSQAALAAIVGAVAVAVAAVGGRFAAALLLGIAGNGLALLFFLYGAPDVALTQVLTETLLLVVFLLVLRHLPDRFEPAPGWAPQWLRTGLSVLVGATVASFALLVGSNPGPKEASELIAAQAEPDAGGRNIVNVILVDFRALDTLGEIAVLAVAGVGVANLVRAAARQQRRPAAPVLLAGEAGPPWRSRLVDAADRGLFHLILVVSIFVLFRGHNAPGGGFAAGLTASAAFAVRYIAGGPFAVRRSLPTRPLLVVAGGLGVALAYVCAPLLWGEALATSTVQTLDVPVIGEVKLATSIVFDLGVYFLVVGVMAEILTRLGGGPAAVSPAVAGRVVRESAPATAASVER